MEINSAPTKVGTRLHDIAPGEALVELMKTGWAPSPLAGVTPSKVVPYSTLRREELSKKFKGLRLIIPAGRFKVRSNDSDFRFRSHSAFSWYSGITASDSVPDSVLVLEPKKGGHEALLFIHPRSPRDTDEFYRNAKQGEFWVGRRMTENETLIRYGIKVKHIDSLQKFLEKQKKSRIIRDQDLRVEKWAKTNKKADIEFLTICSEHRLIKDQYEVDEMQSAIDTTSRGFDDMIKTFPKAVSTPRGERVIEGAFFARARLEGNDIGYDSIVASGSHACILHWIRNDGDVLPGDLILIDAGAETEALYTADITRTLPVNGKFSPAQRRIYDLVYSAQEAGIAAVKPGADYKDFHNACAAVLAKGLAELGVLPMSVEDSLKSENDVHRRWTVHSAGHMLGIDVHDCGQARKENYTEGKLEVGMILTVEPGLYIHPDDELFPVEYRGIGVRIEDDIIVTKDGCRNMSAGIPRQADEVEAWMARLNN